MQCMQQEMCWTFFYRENYVQGYSGLYLLTKAVFIQIQHNQSPTCEWNYSSIQKAIILNEPERNRIHRLLVRI